MKYRRILSYLTLLIGSVLVLYEWNNAANKPYNLTVGLVLLMAGLFGIYRGITTKSFENSFIQSDEEE